MNRNILIKTVKLKRVVVDRKKSATYIRRKLAIVLLLVLSAFVAYSQTNYESSLRSVKYYAYSNGWLYQCISEPNNNNYPLCRFRLSDFKKETILKKTEYVDFFTVDNNQLFVLSNVINSQGIYKRSFYSDYSNRISIKKVDNYISNMILFDNKLYYSQAIDSICEKGGRNICSINTNGKDDTKLTGCYYGDFCIYKGMIFARKSNSNEIDKLDIDGNLIDNYGKVGAGYFDVHNDCIYYLDNNNLYKIDINTKNKQAIKNFSLSVENPIINNNYLFFNTGKETIVNNNTGARIGNYGDLCCINLESGELKFIYSNSLCALFYVYNGIIYFREYGLNELKEFQINIDGTGKKSIEM